MTDFSSMHSAAHLSNPTPPEQPPTSDSPDYVTLKQRYDDLVAKFHYFERLGRIAGISIGAIIIGAIIAQHLLYKLLAFMMPFSQLDSNPFCPPNTWLDARNIQQELMQPSPACTIGDNPLLERAEVITWMLAISIVMTILASAWISLGHEVGLGHIISRRVDFVAMTVNGLSLLCLLISLYLGVHLLGTANDLHIYTPMK